MIIVLTEMKIISEILKIALVVGIVLYVGHKHHQYQLTKEYELKLKANAVMCPKGLHPVEKGKSCHICPRKKSLFSNDLYVTDLRQLDLYE